jgi:transposase
MMVTNSCKVEIMPTFTDLVLSDSDFQAIIELERESFVQNNLKLYCRCRALIAFGYNKVPKKDVVLSLGITRQALNKWIRLFKKSGIDGLRLGIGGGSESRLTKQQLESLSQIVLDGPEAHGFDTAIWTSPLIREVVIKEFGVKYDVSHIRRILDKLGFSVQYPRVHLSKADHKLQKNWLEMKYPDIKKKPAWKME